MARAITLVGLFFAAVQAAPPQRATVLRHVALGHGGGQGYLFGVSLSSFESAAKSYFEGGVGRAQHEGGDYRVMIQTVSDMAHKALANKERATPILQSTATGMLDTITQVLLPGIRQAHDADQILMDELYAKMHACDETKNTKQLEAQGEMIGDQNSCRDAQREMTERRKTASETAESSLKGYADHNAQMASDCCGAKAAQKLTLPLAKGALGCDYRTKSAQECANEAYAMLENLKANMTGAAQKYKTLTAACSAAKASVEKLRQEAHDAVVEANTIIDDMNAQTTACNKGLSAAYDRSKAICTEYDACHTKTTAAWNAQKERTPTTTTTTLAPVPTAGAASLVPTADSSTVADREADRKVEMQQVKDLECVLRAIVGDAPCQGNSLPTPPLSPATAPTTGLSSVVPPVASTSKQAPSSMLYEELRINYHDTVPRASCETIRPMEQQQVNKYDPPSGLGASTLGEEGPPDLECPEAPAQVEVAIAQKPNCPGWCSQR